MPIIIGAPPRRTVLGRMAASLPLLSRLWFAPVLLSMTSACAPQPAKQENYFAKAAELKTYLEAQGLLGDYMDIDINKPKNIKITPEILSRIVKNGWSKDLLKFLDLQLKEKALGNTEKRIFWAFKPEGESFVAGFWPHKHSSKTQTRLIFFDLSTDISKWGDKQSWLYAILQHEIAHSYHRLFFAKKRDSRGKIYSSSNNFFARHAPLVLDTNLRKRPEQAIANEVASLNEQLAKKAPITQLMEEVITYEKLPASVSIHLYRIRIDYRYLDEHLKGTSSPSELALDLLMAEKLGEIKTAAQLRCCAVNLPPRDKEIFLKAYNLLYLQHEVSRRFIDYSEVGIIAK